jgi:signal transduction histidine kinase
MANNTEFFIHAKGSSTLIRRHNDFYRLRIDNNTLTSTLLFGDLACMENQPVYTMIYDSLSRMLLLGTQNAGLWCITPELFRPLTFRSKNFIDNVFMSFQPLRNGLILTNSGILDHVDDRRSSLFADTAKIDWVCIYRAGDSSIWCSKDKRLYHYDPAFRKGVLIDTAQLESYITGMTTDSENILWISTFSSLIKIENGKLKPVVDRFRDFINHTIESIAAITPTKLWLATRNGLYVFDKTTGEIEPQPILPDTYVRTIFRARDRSLWIGTYGSGYYKYDRGKFYRMPLDADKYLEEANGFLEDNKGFLWISTNHGLFSIFKADLDKIAQGYNIEPFFYYYDKSYGLATNEFNGGCNPSAEEDSHGRFYFPSMNGLVCFSPDSCRGELPDKALYLDAIYVDSTAKYYGEKMNIDPDFTRMQVQVSTPFYGSAENLRIEYCLNPDKWYPVNADGKILINRLPAGNYNLRIRKRNGWHTGDYATMTIPFKVRPYWYNTPVFWVVLWVVILLLVVQLRTRFLRRQNLRLQIMVNERTQELEKSTLIKENLLSIIMHDMRSPLNAQNFLIEQLYQDIRHVSLDTAEQLLRGLLDSGKSIAQFSADFLMWYDSQQEHFTVRKRQVPMLPFVEALLHVYRHVTDRPGLSLHYDVTPELVAYSDENLLGIVVRNLLDNAIKHTPNGCITIKAFRDDLRVVIEVTDTGRGMHPDKIKELCGPSSTARASGHSFGYRFIREFSQRLGAELNIVSEPGAGTTVTVSFVG